MVVVVSIGFSPNLFMGKSRDADFFLNLLLHLITKFLLSSPLEWRGVTLVGVEVHSGIFVRY